MQAAVYQDMTISRERRGCLFKDLFLSSKTTYHRSITHPTHLPSSFKLVHPWSRHCQSNQDDHDLLSRPSWLPLHFSDCSPSVHTDHVEEQQTPDQSCPWGAISECLIGTPQCLHPARWCLGRCVEDQKQVKQGWKEKSVKNNSRSSFCGTRGWVASLQCQDAGLIPRLAWWVKRIWHCNSYRSDMIMIPGLGTPYPVGWPKKEKEKKHNSNILVHQKRQERRVLRSCDKYQMPHKWFEICR